MPGTSGYGGLRFELQPVKKKFKVIVDYGNGMGSLVAQKFFTHLNCEVVHLFKELDGTFPNHEANPLKEETLDAIKKEIKAKNVLGQNCNNNIFLLKMF